MLHVDHLLCLVSGRATTSAALQRGTSLGQSLDASVHVVSVDDAPSESFEGDVKQVVRTAGLSLERCVVPSSDEGGPLGERIRSYVRQTRIDLVVADTPADRGSMPPLSAPMLQTLLEQLECPTFIVEQDTGTSPVDRILVPTDFSQHSLTALGHAAALATVYDGSIDLLHVIDTIPYVALTPVDRLSMSPTSFPEQRARRKLSSFLDLDAPTNVSVDAHIRYGEPVDQIGHFIRRHQIDLMVLASHGRQTSPRTPLGHVADRLLRRIACSTFVVRAFGSVLTTVLTSDQTTKPEANE